MSYRSLAPENVWAFLVALPVRTAKLATVRADGRPHVAPVWYVLDDDGSLLFNTGEATVKGRNLRRDPRVALCVEDDRPPFSFVTMEGVVEISDDLDEVRQLASRIGGRYMGAERAEEYGARNGVAGELAVRVQPLRIVSAFDLAD
jgi:PPOX class probable F420-dependent enzyme